MNPPVQSPQTPSVAKTGTPLPTAEKKIPKNFYLVKVPDFLYENLKAATEKIKNGEFKPLGTIDVTSPAALPNPKDPKKPRELNVTLSEGEISSGLPKEYRMRLTPISSLYFMREENDELAKFLGPVREKGEIQAVLNPEYRSFLLERSKVQNTPKRRIETEDDSGSSMKSGFMRPVSEHPDRVKKIKPSTETKAERMPKEMLVNKLFGLFAEQEAYTLKELTVKTNQPQQFLKDVVSEIAVVIKEDGSAKYHLKPEYKTTEQRRQQAKQP